MKLYATTTSERASKGQGGNKYINIELYVGEAKYPLFIGKIKLYIENDLYCLDWYNDIDVKPLKRLPVLEKGKSQKGEDDRHCHLCGSICENKYCTNETCAEYQ